MKRFLALLTVLALMLALVPAALADDETVNINDSADLMAAIANQAPGQTWNIAAGVYDISVLNTTINKGSQTGWYFPIIFDNITINGAGVDSTTITSSVVSANGSWASQDFISIWSDNVTIQDLTIRPKLDTNKAIEVLGKNVTLKNIEILHNNIVSQESYTSQKNSAGETGNYWYGYTQKFAGSILFYPQNIEGDIGDAVLDNVLVTQAWISCPAQMNSKPNVLKGTLTLKGCTTIDFRGSWYAGVAGYATFVKNDNITINAEDFHILYDEGQLAQAQVLDGAPVGTKLNVEPHTVVCEPEVNPTPTPTANPTPTPTPEKLYRIDIVTGEGGAVNPISPTFAAVGGASVPITFTPKQGYMVYDVKVDGVSVGAVKSYTFTNVLKDHKIEVIFAKEGTAKPPQTGEQNTLMGYVMILIGLAAAAFVVIRRGRAR